MSGADPVKIAFRGDLGGFRLDCAFTAPATGVTALFGPSGCGKTSVLRCTAGLHRVAEGTCSVHGQVWQDAGTFLPPHRRPIGYVFQEASLFPHLSVRANLLYGAPRDPGTMPFEEVIRLLGLAPLLPRSPSNLSGGERQRMAIGRALLSQPELLLMDEPLSALDQATRNEILPFIERLHETLALPILYVSHDMTEVERLADHIVLLDAGRVPAAGPLTELQSDIALPLASARDAAVGLEGVVRAFDPAYGMLSLEVRGGVFLVPFQSVPAGDRRRLRIGARDISLARTPAESTIMNVLPARILAARQTDGFEMIASLGLGEAGAGARLLSRMTRQSWDRLSLSVGDTLYAQVKAVGLTRLGGHPEAFVRGVS
jgi:molybdate transport system ATP-binding protein